MFPELIKRIRQSFSAKIITLVTSSVIVTSFVVGLATTRSTRGFLSEKASAKFPSVLTSVQAKVRTWYIWQFGDLERLCQPEMFLNNLSVLLVSETEDAVAEDSQGELRSYLHYIHDRFPVYEELTVYSTNGKVIASTADSTMYGDTVERLILDAVEEPHFSRAESFRDEGVVYQWLLVPVRREEDVMGWMIARVDLHQLTQLFREASASRGADVFLLDGQGRFITQPSRMAESVLGQKAMQVPTRQTGAPQVEKRNNFDGHAVIHSKSHLEAQGWWLVYEEDYGEMMAPVIHAQRRIWEAVLIIGAISILVGARIAKSILRPIHDLALGARRINEGLVGVKIPRRGNDEIAILTDTFNEMAKKITLSLAELQYKKKVLDGKNDELLEMNERLEKLSITDGLTNLFNHRHFWNLLNTELTRVHLYQGELALVLVDLDDFKRVNDQFGHSVGDLLLQSVARILQENVRDTDIVARYGGEEFAILLPDTNLMERGTADVAEEIRAAIESMRFKVPETDIGIKVTVSIGVSVFRGNRREFFNAADRALYQSKAEGKNRVRYAPEA